jgi:hypothetical protein
VIELPKGKTYRSRPDHLGDRGAQLPEAIHARPEAFLHVAYKQDGRARRQEAEVVGHRGFEAIPAVLR